MGLDGRRFAVVEANRVTDDEDTGYARRYAAEGVLTYASVGTQLSKIGGPK